MKKVDIKKEKEEKAQPLESDKIFQGLEKQGTPMSLSKSLAVELMKLIKEVNKHGVTPETVNASCNAAGQINKILRLVYDMQR